ncbi:MAG: hypothetical protein QM647_01480 [Asticcacaulis sp.]|uniref:hypothetical protein n=1 Tax=Asticcacaulis sp. TaxID=1872648 RepID=UPI0039E598E1
MIIIIISVFHYFIAMHGIWALLGGHVSIVIILAFASIALLKYVEKRNIKAGFNLRTSENAVIGISLLAFIIFFAPTAYSDPDKIKRIIFLSIFEGLMLISSAYYYWRYFSKTKPKHFP